MLDLEEAEFEELFTLSVVTSEGPEEAQR